jgi:hypothetical protein
MNARKSMSIIATLTAVAVGLWVEVKHTGPNEIAPAHVADGSAPLPLLLTPDFGASVVLSADGGAPLPPLPPPPGLAYKT